MNDINLAIDRIVITGNDITLADADRFHQLLRAELERLLLQQYGTGGVDTNSEIARIELAEMDMSQGNRLEDIAGEVARRIAMSIALPEEGVEEQE